MRNIQLAIALIGTGLSIAFISLGYVHANFSSKEVVNGIQLDVRNSASKEDIKNLERKVDRITNILIERR
jgi:hypothetical protein